MGGYPPSTFFWVGVGVGAHLKEGLGWEPVSFE